jgi:hypothetical protein
LRALHYFCAVNGIYWAIKSERWREEIKIQEAKKSFMKWNANLESMRQT